MGHFLQDVEITNFKSIRHQKIEGCRRINVFIGYPNVGKSNILEALGLFSLPYLKVSGKKKLTEFIRVENLQELFYEADTAQPLEVRINGGEMNCKGQLDRSTAYPLACIYERAIMPVIYFNESFSARFDDSIITDDGGRFESFPFIKKYRFSAEEAKAPKRYFPFLLPPKGPNLFSQVVEHKALKNFLAEEVGRSGGEFVYDRSENTGRVFKKTGADTYSIPYTSLADTLQRLTFYKAAITTNSNSAIVLEEPEAHMFPPYIRSLTWDVVSAESNQFFIATHSPFVLDMLLEEAADEVSIYLVDYRDGETKIQLLSEEFRNEIREYGVDIFFNVESYLKRGQEHPV